MRCIFVSGWICTEPQIQKSKKGTDYMSFRITSWIYGDPVTPDGKHKSMFITVNSFDSSMFSMITNNLIKKGRHVTIMGDIQSVDSYLTKEGQPAASMNVKAKSIYLDDYNGEKNQQPNNNGYGVQMPNNGMVGGYAPQQQMVAEQMAQPQPMANPQMAAPQVAIPNNGGYQGYQQPQMVNTPQQMAAPQMYPQGYGAQPQQMANPQIAPQTAQTLEQLKQAYPNVQPSVASASNDELPF